MKFYKRDPDAALSGMAELSLAERGAYNTIIDLLYSRDGLVRDDDDLLRRVQGCHGNEWRSIKRSLVAKGKIWAEDGWLKAKRVDSVLKEAANFSETQRIRSTNRWETEAKRPAKNKKASQNQQSPDAKDKMPLTPIATPTPTPTPKEESSLRSDITPEPEPVVVVPRPGNEPDLFEIPSFLLRNKPAGVVPIVEGAIVEAPAEPADDMAKAVEAYNRTAKFAGWPACSRLTAPRERALRARLEESDGIRGWCAAMARAAKSSFLLGRSGRGGDHSNWRPGIDFFLRAEKFTKLMEGGYDDTPGKANGGSSALDEGAARAAAAYG